jgi:hypothetical protein
MIDAIRNASAQNITSVTVMVIHKNVKLLIGVPVKATAIN